MPSASSKRLPLRSSPMVILMIGEIIGDHKFARFHQDPRLFYQFLHIFNFHFGKINLQGVFRHITT